MRGIVAWFARNAVAANLLMIVAFTGGVFGYTKMEQEMFPVVNITGASVSVTWNGASPQDVEDQIVTRIEEAVADIDGLDRITSIANEGFGVVNIKGRDDIDMDKFLDDVKIRVDQINNMPQAAFQPQVTRWEQRNNYIGLSVHGNVDARTLRRVGDRVRDDIANINGGELAQLGGVIDEQVNIEVSEEQLRRYGLSFSDVASAIRQSSLNSSGGRIESSTGDVAITARQLADTADQFGNIIIRQSTEQGTIRVADVATIDDGFATDKFKATYNNEPTVFVQVPQPNTMHIVEYTDDIKAYVDRANDPSNGILPEAVKIDILFDDSVAFNARMDLIQQSALTGAVLVMLVLLLFLRPTVALWVTIGIITAFAGGILLLPYFGVSWNILSTFAVLLVIGVIVDDAIIVGENIHREIESGRREGLDAAIVGTQLVLKPVVFGVLTTIIAFLPWAFISGPTRMFTQQITFVVVAALIFSIIECMLILPSHLSHMKRQSFDGPSGKLLKLQHSIADSLLWFANNLYKPLLELAIRYRYATVMFFFCLFFLATRITGMGIVPFKFMPEIEADLVRVEIDMPDGTPYTRLEQIRDQLQAGIDVTMAESIKQYPNIEGGLIKDAAVVASGTRVNAWIGVLPPEDRPVGLRSKDIAEQLRLNVGDIQDAEEINFDFTFNDEQSGVRFALNHQDLDRLREAAAAVKEHLATYANAYDIGDNLSSAAEEIRISLKPGAETLGITLASVTDQVRQAYYGEEAQRLPRDGEDVRVMVRLPESARENLDSLNSLRVRTSDGREIPVTQVANFDYAPGINRIVRRNRTRSVSVYSEVLGDGGRNQIMASMDENFWPDFEKTFPDVERGVAGGIEEEQKFMEEVGRLILIAIGAMYILLAVAFRSYAQPLLLMMALPFAYCGAVFGLWIFDTPMAMFSFFGIAAAAGVVINDNLVLIDYVNRRRDEGAGAVQALVDGGVSRFRPILLTSVTTFVGILPLIAEKSVQAQFLKPMVVSLGAAVAFALFVSLLMVPALYAVGVEIGRIFRWTWGGKPFRQIGETYSGEVTIDEDELIGTSKDGGLGPMAPAE
ncbi:efflux RND transporter permease subunit [Hyphomonas sp.]|uniref:efflux RND transporter permease subunit n=1 Tax=Hyphomonas sp. TaxID=87 RepID=UPI000E01E2B5|nr:efflux RND transporter permease subunit [Hyphomonas sp.]RCL88929.1 MAG: AcrB/AcrD/AcrF family protein [Hyphomonas sp.]